MTAGGGFDLVGYQVAGLEGVGHSTGAHADAVADADSAELVANDGSIFEGGFDLLTQAEEVFVASGSGVRWGRKERDRNARISLIPGIN